LGYRVLRGEADEVIGRVVRVLDLGEADVAAWQDLSRSAVEANPLFEPACILPAARFLPNGFGVH
jgi:hypothetical protein